MSLGRDLEIAKLNLIGKTEQQIRAALFKVAELTIRATPVDTGRARGNWQASINKPILQTLKRNDKSGAGRIKRAQAVIDKVQIGNTFFLTNNLPYALRLEFGWSKQAPTGMLRNAVSAVARALR